MVFPDQGKKIMASPFNFPNFSFTMLSCKMYMETFELSIEGLLYILNVSFSLFSVI